MPHKESEFFGLRHAETGELIRLNPEAGDGYFELTLRESCPLLTLDSAHALAMLLMKDTPSYNAQSASSASWGRFQRKHLVPVKVRVTETVEDLALREPLQVKTHEVRTIPRKGANAYAKEPLPHPEDPFACFWLAYLPEGLTIADVNERVGERVYPAGDRYLGRQLLKAVAVPEEYEDLMTQGPGVLLLTRDAFEPLD